MVAIITDDHSQARRMNLPEYMEFVEDNVDPTDFDSIVETAWALRALANDRDFVLNKYHDEIKKYWSGSSENESLPQSIVYEVNSNFYVRTNIWIPISEQTGDSEFQKALYSYEMAHDHNFHFVTTGYFGSGYETDLYLYDRSKVEGYVGEPVDLEPQGRERLAPGCTMVYESGRDVHVQHSPQTVSVSLNLMCRPADAAITPQYIFDTRAGCIAKGAGDLVSTRLYLLEMCRHIYDGQTIEILSDIVAAHRCLRTRAQALNILREICPQDCDMFENRASAKVVALSNRALAFGSGTRDHLLA